MKQNSYQRPGILRTTLYPNDFKRNVTSYHAMSILWKIKDRKVLAPEWDVFYAMSPEDLAAILLELAQGVRLQAIRKSPPAAEETSTAG